LAKIYRKRKDYQKEVDILARYEQQYFIGGKSQELLERLDKVRQLLTKSAG
jgi:hypothetical protein